MEDKETPLVQASPSVTDLRVHTGVDADEFLRE
jgi:hypothetical protein